MGGCCCTLCPDLVCLRRNTAGQLPWRDQRQPVCREQVHMVTCQPHPPCCSLVTGVVLGIAIAAPSGCCFCFSKDYAVTQQQQGLDEPAPSTPSPPLNAPGQHPCSLLLLLLLPLADRYEDKEVQRDKKLVSYDIVDKQGKPYVKVNIGKEDKVRVGLGREVW